MQCRYCKEEFSYTVLPHHIDRCEKNKNKPKPVVTKKSEPKKEEPKGNDKSKE